MGRTIGKSAIEVMRKRFPDKASEIETYADSFDVLAEAVKQGGGGGSVTVDSSLSGTSENPVQNKIIKAALDALEAAIEAVNNDYKVTLRVTVDEQTQQLVITTDKSVADIYAAAVDGKHVYAVVEIAQGYYQRFELHEYSEVEVVFYAVQKDEDGAASTAKPVLVVGNAVSGWDFID